MVALVFLDSNVLKFSATELVRYRPRIQQVNWGPRTLEVVVRDEVLINPNDAIQNADLKAEVDLLPRVASLHKVGGAQFVRSVEALMETWCLPSLDSESGQFYGAEIRTLKDVPFEYGRVMAGSGLDFKREQVRFLSDIKNSRFDALKRACGAYQGENRLPNRNQLLDAFHVWCAESAGCTHFLTLDFKLQRVLERSRLRLKTQIVRPSQLLASEEISKHASG